MSTPPTTPFAIRGYERDRANWSLVTTYDSEGVWHDGWLGREGSFTITPRPSARHLRIVGNKMHHPDHLTLLVDVDGVTVRREILSVGHFIIDLPTLGPVPQPLTVKVSASATFVPAEVGVNGEDRRELSWILVAIEGIG